MKIGFKILSVLFVLAFSSCNKFLDRPPLTDETDATAWTSEEKLRLYANKYYTDFFVGFGVKNSNAGAPIMGFTNTDDIVRQGGQTNFTRSVPVSSIWSYSTVRSINIMIERIEERMSDVLSDEAKAHWLGIGRFFRALRYSELVEAYGDVPYYDREIKDTELDELYKSRTPRNEVMDHVYDDWQFAMENVRTDDGELNVNKYIVAGFVSRLALNEGTWQKYYYEDNDRAKKFLDLSIEAANVVMSSGKYNIVTDYKTLFTSKDLSGNRECILYRKYDPAAGVTHAIATNNNLAESTLAGPTTDLIKSYICTDGKPWEVSDLPNAKEFDLANLIKTRDSRFEATFYSKPSTLNRGSFYYITKYFPRDAEKQVREGRGVPAEFLSDNNETDAPILRYSEVLLNWIEAKAEAASIGGSAVLQDDIDRSINKIRSRPLPQEAKDRGVTNTKDLNIASIANDPNRDSDVSPLLWEIRRERRMEFVFETSRLTDLKRWSKLEYMDTDANEDLMSGGWVNFPSELSIELAAKNVGILAVVNTSGAETVYNGNNAASMIGFYKNIANRPRLPFINQANINPYLAPIGQKQIDEYALKGYVLKQTQGWPQN